MSVPDLLNACLEAAMGYAGWKNLQAIRRDKTIKGVHWYATGVAAVWGYFNLFYYPHLGQYTSFVAGMGICGINTAWLCFAWKFSRPGYAVTESRAPINPVSVAKQ